MAFIQEKMAKGKNTGMSLHISWIFTRTFKWVSIWISTSWGIRNTKCIRFLRTYLAITNRQTARIYQTYNEEQYKLQAKGLQNCRSGLNAGLPMSSDLLHKIAKMQPWKLWSSTVLQPFVLQRHIAPLWKGLIHIERQKKLKGVLVVLRSSWAHWNTPGLLHKQMNSRFVLLLAVCTEYIFHNMKTAPPLWLNITCNIPKGVQKLT